MTCHLVFSSFSFFGGGGIFRLFENGDISWIKNSEYFKSAEVVTSVLLSLCLLV